LVLALKLNKHGEETVISIDFAEADSEYDNVLSLAELIERLRDGLLTNKTLYGDDIGLMVVV